MTCMPDTDVYIIDVAMTVLPCGHASTGTEARMLSCSVPSAPVISSQVKDNHER